MKTVKEFLRLLWISRYKKSPIHKSYCHYLRHAWRLAKEIFED